jgi:putative tricarboxylic transport membrane protein
VTNAVDRSVGAGRRSLGHSMAVRGASIFIVAVGAAFLIPAARLPIGTLSTPGPGMWPLVAAIVVVGLGIMSASTPDPSVEALETSKREFAGAGIAFAELFGFIAAFWFFGYFLAAFLVVLVMGKTFSDQSWKRLLVLAVLFGVVVHVFFALVLALPAPNPPLWAW